MQEQQKYSDLKRLLMAESRKKRVRAEVWRTGAVHMQLREQICARKYANSRFV